jgi:rfaE bifunctional protein nucleotidyltransferase chain/domain
MSTPPRRFPAVGHRRNPETSVSIGSPANERAAPSELNVLGFRAVSVHEARGQVSMGQVVGIEQLAELGARLRRAGKRVVFTNGHFDLLHVGHLRYLQAAQSMGDCLVVGLNDDAITTRRKGPTRPIVPEDERAELLAGLACVDYAVVFHDETAERCVELLRPDVYVKGGDYAMSDAEIAAGKQPLPEARIVRSYGGEVRTVPLVPGRSTSEIERAIVARACGAGSPEHSSR